MRVVHARLFAILPLAATVGPVAALVLPSTAAALVLCTTPDGRTYAGDTPPPGCKVKSDYRPEKATPPLEQPAIGEPVPQKPSSDDAFSVRASRTRTEIERGLNEGAARLADIRERIEKVRGLEPQGDPRFTASQQDVAELANFQSRKQEALRDLRSEERQTYAAIADLWRQLADLDALVTERYGGKAPDWWRSTVRCSACPSRSEAEDALK